MSDPSQTSYLLMCVQNLLCFGGPKVSHFPPSKAQQRLQLSAVERAERWFEAVVTVPAAADIVDFVRGGEGGYSSFAAVLALDVDAGVPGELRVPFGYCPA